MAKKLGPALNKRYKAQGGKCFYCDCFLVPFSLQQDGGIWQLLAVTRDHFIPKALGGMNWSRNIVCSCYTCNTQKSNNMPTKRQMSKFRRIYGNANWSEVFGSWKKRNKNKAVNS